MLTLPFSPDATMLLLTAGFALICVEFNRPGFILPGMAGLLITLVAIASALHSPERAEVLGCLAAGLLLLWPRTKYLRGPHALGGAFLYFGFQSLLPPPRPVGGRVLAGACALVVGLALVKLLRIADRARRNKTRRSASNHLD